MRENRIDATHHAAKGDSKGKKLQRNLLVTLNPQDWKEDAKDKYS
jgi:hypothetical protein